MYLSSHLGRSLCQCIFIITGTQFRQINARWIFQHSAATLGVGARDGGESEGDVFVQEQAEGDLLAVFNYLMSGCKADGARL